MNRPDTTYIILNIGQAFVKFLEHRGKLWAKAHVVSWSIEQAGNSLQLMKVREFGSHEVGQRLQVGLE